MQTFQSFLLQEAVKTDNKKPRVLLIMLEGIWDITNKDLAPLRKVANVDFVQVKSMTEEQLAKKCENYDYLMLNMDFLPFPDPNKMEKLTEKFYNHPSIQGLIGINVDMTDADFFSPQLAEEKNIILQTTPNAVTRSVAESAVTEILVHARQRHGAYTDEIKGKKQQCRKGINLHGKTAGIIGYGNIGKCVANILRGMGMNVLVYDVNKNLGVKITPIEKLFRDSDVISIHIPALEKNNNNKSNINFIDARLLNLSKGAILINLATDIIVNTRDVIKALKSGNISAYSVEPGREVTNKLKNIPNAHISPCSFDSDESRKNIVDIWIKNMITAIEGNSQNVWN